MSEQKGKPNRLIHETSPYLLQHAYNPVDWYPWGPEALEKAKKEDKPIIVSIGYSACHWCHVMERESFEDHSIADYMNAHFICIKLDREERPDIDQIYMDAVQAMGMQGGWPLNVFLTPDQKPFYGGTYFPPQSWLKLLQNVVNTLETQREALLQSADQIADIIGRSDVEKYRLSPEEEQFSLKKLEPSLNKLAGQFDEVHGGLDKAPKFPMPSIWMYLLRYAHFTGDEKLTGHVLLTLEKMARGGIYDQIGGGFARYSVDGEWFAPHFEKMGYDNGQLTGLFSEAYQQSGQPLFREVVFDTIAFMERELLNEKGGFYAALDADSEGVEGKFYTWTTDEFREILGGDADLWMRFFGMQDNGNWENGVNILTREKDPEWIAGELGMSPTEAEDKLKEVQKKLLDQRSKRIRPGLDDKILASWNGLILTGLTRAYEAFGEDRFLQLALKNAGYLVAHHIRENRLYRTPLEASHSIPGYLDDYAFVIEGMIRLYQVSFDEQWISLAKKLMDYALSHFYDREEKLFFYTDDTGEKLITRKKELFDNVIPASNSAMATSLHHLGLLFDDDNYMQVSETMLGLITKLLYQEPSYLANWGVLYLMYAQPFAEVAITGQEAEDFRKEMATHYLPNRIFCGTTGQSELPLLMERKAKGPTTIHVCYHKTCKLPVRSVQEALAQIS